MPDITTQRNLRWNYDMKGCGEVLIFLHGWGTSRRIWRQQTETLSERYCTLSLDLPGHGQSDWRMSTLADIATDLNDILEFLKIEKATLIGSSIGGLVSLKLIDFFPEKVKRLILVDSLARFTRSEKFPYGLEISEIMGLQRNLERGFPEILDIFFRSLFTKKEREQCRILWLKKFKKADPVPQREALEGYLSIIRDEDLRDMLGSIHAPVFIINGSEDTIFPKEAAFYMKEAIPGARLYLFKDCGHFPFVTQPQVFNQMIDEFIQNT